MEIEDREQKERLQREAHQNRIKLPKREIDGVVFDTSDRDTRLIGKTPSFLATWDSPKNEKEVCELYWRTKDGNYFISLTAGYVRHIDTRTAHDLLDIGTSDYQWFITDAQKKELKEKDDRMNLEKGSSLR